VLLKNKLGGVSVECDEIVVRRAMKGGMGTSKKRVSAFDWGLHAVIGVDLG